MINWISIDNVTYHWDGNNTITSETANGFSSTLSGHRLDGLDILDSEGGFAGELFVDFAKESITYNAIDSAVAEQVINYGVNDNIYTVPISNVTQLADINSGDILNTEHHDLWLDIAHESQVTVSDDTMGNLMIDSLLSSPEQSLDILLTPSGNNDSITSSSQPYSEDLLISNHLDNAINPLDLLLTYNANSHYG